MALCIPGPGDIRREVRGVRQEGNQGWSSGSDPSQSTGGENDASVRGCGSLWRKRPSLTELTGNRYTKTGEGRFETWRGVLHVL
jgi:hypothetical protein